MNFPTALGMCLGGCPITRRVWDNPEKKIELDTKLGRIRARDAAAEHYLRSSFNYYPTQSDMLADDWELTR